MRSLLHFKASAIVLLFSIALVVLCVPSTCLGDAEKIFRENSPAVVVVASIDKEGKPTSLGSGFIVREDGVIVTNYHVVNMASDIKIKIGYKVRDIEGLLHVDPENDIAIIKVEGKGLPESQNRGCKQGPGWREGLCYREPPGA